LNFHIPFKLLQNTEACLLAARASITDGGDMAILCPPESEIVLSVDQTQEQFVIRSSSGVEMGRRSEPRWSNFFYLIPGVEVGVGALGNAPFPGKG
jgi:hypothetical protein